MFDTSPVEYHFKYVDQEGEILNAVLNKLGIAAAVNIEQLVNFIKECHEQQRRIIDKTGQLFENFPDELLLKIILGVEGTPQELTRLALVSKRWHALMYDKMALKSILEKMSGEELCKLLKKNCEEGSVKNVSILLLDHRINLNTQYEKDNTTLHNACDTGNFELVVLLLNNGAAESLKVSNSEGNLPLHIAAGKGNTQICQLLLQLYLDFQINAQNGFNMTPLHLACIAENIELVTILLVLGAAESINVTNCFGRIPLHIAADTGNHNICKLLLNHYPEAQINALNRKETRPVLPYAQTPLDLAKKIDVIKILLEHGAKKNEDSFPRNNFTATCFNNELLNIAKNGTLIEVKDLFRTTAGFLNYDDHFYIGWVPLREALNELKEFYSAQGGKNQQVISYLEHVCTKLQWFYYFEKKNSKAGRKLGQQSFIFEDSKKKAKLIRDTLSYAWRKVYPNVFEEDIDIKQLEKLLLTTKYNGMTLAEALDTTPAPVAAVFKFFSESYVPPDPSEDPDHSDSSGFDH